MTRVRLATERLAGLDEVIDAALPFREVRAFAVVDAVGNPADDQRLRARVPERAVDAVLLGVDHVEPLLGRSGLRTHFEGRGGLLIASGCRQFEHVIAGRGERRRGSRARRHRRRSLCRGRTPCSSATAFSGLEVSHSALPFR